jgi:cadmium resistance protein CadD (predicted permease)
MNFIKHPFWDILIGLVAGFFATIFFIGVLIAPSVSTPASVRNEMIVSKYSTLIMATIFALIAVFLIVRGRRRLQRLRNVKANGL